MASRHLNGEGRGELLRHRGVRPATKGVGVVRPPAVVAGVAAAAARMLYGAMRFFKILFWRFSLHLFISKQS